MPAGFLLRRSSPRYHSKVSGSRRILAIADDLTGALEAGAKLDVPVTTSLVFDAPALVIDTETRHVSAAEAAVAVSQALRDRVNPGDLIYKKTDSTLRGNIAAELRALSQYCGGRTIGYVGAYPMYGRTVRDGRLFVHGVPVEMTSFACDALNPVGNGDLRSLLQGFDCVVYDGETDADVARAVSDIEARGYIPAGTAAVASYLAPAPSPLRLPPVRTCCIVNGSRHPASQRQIGHMKSCALPELWQIIEESRTPAPHVCRLLATTAIDCVIVFGGDTAYAITLALGVELFEPIGELAPGIPISRMAGRSELLVTKAGGFGDDNLLASLAAKLSAQQ